MDKAFNQTHRKVYGEKAVEFSSLSIGALIFGQLLSKNEISSQLLILGLLLFLAWLTLSYVFLKGVKGGEKT